MNVEARDPNDPPVLERGIRAGRDGRRRERYRCVLLAMRGFEAPQIAGQPDRAALILKADVANTFTLAPLVMNKPLTLEGRNVTMHKWQLGG
jgi:hypothetical protein